MIIGNNNNNNQQPTDNLLGDNDQQATTQLLLAGQELLLECVTPDLGQPRANIRLWFKNDQPIEFSDQQDSSAASGSGNQFRRRFEDVSPTTGAASGPKGSQLDKFASGFNNALQSDQQFEKPEGSGLPNEADDGNKLDSSFAISSGNNQQQQKQSIVASRIRLLQSGKYLYIPSIQLAHKGNYSCVAVNRLGSGSSSDGAHKIGQLAPTNGNFAKDQTHSSLENSQQQPAYQLDVAQAPEFVQALPSRTIWPESHDDYERQSLELVCHVQCEPICHISWTRNGELVDGSSQNLHLASQRFVSYQVRDQILSEDKETNKFKSIESRLVFQFGQPIGSHDERNASLAPSISDLRRHLANSIYQCQSSPNIAGPSIKSSTSLIVQCK